MIKNFLFFYFKQNLPSHEKYMNLRAKIIQKVIDVGWNYEIEK